MSSIIDNNVQGIVLADEMQDPGNGEQLDTVTTSLNLVNAIFDNMEKYRLYDDEVQIKILNAIQDGYIDLNKVNKSLRSKIAQL